MLIKVIVVFFIQTQMILGSTFVFAPALIQAKFWKIAQQEKSGDAWTCVLRCKSANCPGVAFNRAQGLCLYGEFQSDPENGGEDIVEVWISAPWEKYIVNGDTQVATISSKYCHTYTNWIIKPNRKRYHFTSTPLAWEDHKALCEARGAQLAQIKSKADEDAVLQLTAGHETWLGLTNPVSEKCENESCNGKMVWKDGTTLKYDSNIFSKSLVSDAGSFCIRVRSVDYNDKDCADLMTGLCEVTCT